MFDWSLNRRDAIRKFLAAGAAAGMAGAAGPPELVRLARAYLARTRAERERYDARWAAPVDGLDARELAALERRWHRATEARLAARDELIGAAMPMGGALVPAGSGLMAIVPAPQLSRPDPRDDVPVPRPGDERPWAVCTVPAAGPATERLEGLAWAFAAAHAQRLLAGVAWESAEPGEDDAALQAAYESASDAAWEAREALVRAARGRRLALAVGGSIVAVVGSDDVHSQEADGGSQWLPCDPVEPQVVLIPASRAGATA